MIAAQSVFRRTLSGVASARVPLAYELHGPQNTKNPEDESPILFLHGFLGSKRENRSASRNISCDRTFASLIFPALSRSLARNLSRRVYALDLRNHGDAGHHPRHDYREMALDVEAFIKKHRLQRPTVVGHSMGAKTALSLALHSPDLIENVVAIDNCPIKLPLSEDFPRYLEAMAKVRDAQVKTHSEADEILKQCEESPAIRLWLLSNFVRDQASPNLRLRLPLEVLQEAIGPLGDFPYKKEPVVFRRRALFLRALQSPYIPETALPVILSFFPRAEVVDFDCGHWIVQDRPQQFLQGKLAYLHIGDIHGSRLLSGGQIPAGLGKRVSTVSEQYRK
ncbi:Alpha/Beta hydrolase protein [Penicillium hispanicum]|uniref:Alpha/Beta hydrolase protein n=1 Tax=Penicillium hispanicum TaxID=1080232 RepID=UPI0025426142|nr:Alpha/Beta hydrolase protein [Penicillium hispanicum]KAJ5573716.1 Alpha/Beta hydrolase protein [Penicillium hispanicum]